MRTLVGHNGRINAITQSNRSIYVWVSAATDCTVTLWDTRQHPANVQVRHFDRPISCARYSPNDAFIALGSDQLYLMDPRVREYRSLPSLSQVLHVCFHPTEYLLATGSADRLVRFWDIETAECVSQSGPADGTLREIVFQSDGTALLTLTDCRCSALSWEPFEMLGQCLVPQTDYSLGLASSDSEVYVLGRSVSLNNISLFVAPYAKLLAQEELLEIGDLKLEGLSEEVSPSDLSGNEAEGELGLETKNIREEEKEERPPVVHYYGDHRAFIPSHTLPRTPPPRPMKTVAAHSDSINVSMATAASPSALTAAVATATSMPARPKTLKTRRSDVNNSKIIHSKVSSNTRKSNGSETIPRTSLSGQPSRRSTHPSGSSIMKVTNSAPDVRFASKKQDEKNRLRRRDSDDRKRQRQREQQPYHDRDQSPEVVPSEPCSLNDMQSSLDKLEKILSQRRNVLDNVVHCWRTRGSEAAIAEAARSTDMGVLAELIDAFNNSPAAWNLTLCTAILPHIEPLVVSNNEDFVEVALNSLRTIITGCGDVIRTGSHHRAPIGVDVQAEERHAKCVRCMQQLTNMRVKATLLVDHMSKQQSREFNALMQIFDDTLSPL